MKRPSIFIYQFHRRRTIRAQSSYWYLIILSMHITLSPNLIARFQFVARKRLYAVAQRYLARTRLRYVKRRVMSNILLEYSQQ